MIVLHVLAPAPVGGLERVVQSLALGLQRQQVEVHVVPVFSEPWSGHPFLEPFAGSDVQLHPLQVSARAYLRERAMIAELCRRYRPDIVHTHGYRSDIIAAPVGRAHGAATITTVHGFTGGGLRNRLYETVQRRALRGFDAVIAVSRALSNRLRSQGVTANRLRMIQNAFPGAVALQSRQQARARLGITDDRFQLGWVGRLSHEKGPDQMIDALALLDTSKVALTIIGDGPERARLRAQAERLEVASAIRWAGSQPAAAQLFSAFDAFVLSSRTEGIPMVLFEAMAAGLPIVATRVGGVPEVLDDGCAYLVESGDATQLASAIDTLRTDLRFAGRTARARQRLDTQFSTDAWIVRHKALYCEFQRLPEDACLALSH